MKRAFTNGVIYTGEAVLQAHAVLTEEGKITGCVKEKEIPSGYELTDLEGHNIAPALIDLQIYGGYGKMFSVSPSVEALTSTYAYCKDGGAAYFQATVATNSMEIMLRAIEAVKTYRRQGLPGLIGLHLEGPYLNPEKKGAHLPQYLKRPSVNEVQYLLDQGKGVITMMTLAPEMCGREVISLLQSNGVAVSAGHSNATYAQAMNAFEGGIRTATHLFNAMSPLQSRAPGLVGAIYDSSAYSSVVADGIHVDFAAVRISKKIMGERLFLITDAVTENKSGEYIYLLEKDRYVTGTGILAGSSLTMMHAVSNGVKQVGLTGDEALRMGSLYPARVMGLENSLGKIKSGYRADLVVFDRAFRVKEVHTSGN